MIGVSNNYGGFAFRMPMKKPFMEGKIKEFGPMRMYLITSENISSEAPHRMRP